MAARDRVDGPLNQFLLDCANAKECTSDDLSVALMRAGETLALESYRRGDEDAAAELEQLRARVAELEQLRAPAAASSSQVMPAGVWEDPSQAVTPAVVLVTR